MKRNVALSIVLVGVAVYAVVQAQGASGTALCLRPRLAQTDAEQVEDRRRHRSGRRAQ